MLVLLKICIAYFLIIVIQLGDARDIVRIIGTEACLERSTNEIEFRNITVRTIGRGESALFGNIRVKSELRNVQKVAVKVMKCSKHPPSNCEKVMQMNITDICNKLKKRGEAWSFFTSEAVPPIVCPIKGRHELKGNKVDEKLIKSFSPVMGDNIWRLRFQIYSHNQVMGCFWLVFHKEFIRDRWQ